MLKSTEASDQMHTSIDNSLHSSARALAKYHSRQHSGRRHETSPIPLAEKEEGSLEGPTDEEPTFGNVFEEQAVRLPYVRPLVNTTASAVTPSSSSLWSRVKRLGGDVLHRAKDRLKHRWMAVLVVVSLLFLSYGRLSQL